MSQITFKNLGLTPYKEVWDYQRQWLEDALEQKKDGKAISQELIFVEHPHVYTLGKSADTSNLLVNQAFLDSIEAKSYIIERGGDITYHGPGQLVIYPLLDLEKLNIGIKQYVHLLEESIIHVLAQYQITGERIEGKTGIWIAKNKKEERKIAAIGIKCSRYLTIHGLALNINTNLEYFKHIVPCGLSDSMVTSLSNEKKTSINMQEVINHFQSQFTRQFNT